MSTNTNDFGRLLDDSLQQIASGAASQDDVLAMHPEHAAELRPLLQSADRLQRGRELMPSAAYKERARAAVGSHVRTHPRQPPARKLSPFTRMMISLAALAAAFAVTGTALAQNALPGDTLYGWKLSSERLWRAASPDPVGVDLYLAGRRAGEVTSVAHTACSANCTEIALSGYHEVLTRLEFERNATPKSYQVLQTLESHQKEFTAAGINDLPLNTFLTQLNSHKP